MNIGFGLAVLALAQLVLPPILDRTLTAIDQPWFVQLMTARGDDGLGVAGAEGRRGGIGQMFTETTDELGVDRTKAVLAAYGLISSARSVFVSLCITCLGTAVTLFLVIQPTRPPPHQDVRAGLLAAATVLVLFLGFQLRSRMDRRALASTIQGEGRFRRQPSPPNRWRLFWFRVRSRDVLTRYVVASLLGNATTIVTALGL